ncbi:hypothetical protein H2200_010914 [Cladophialophora chaetospira]|uniref:Uncharacterized protein n=1 Tax=Cladophialophora chaetospira TaxID=386627 RepID=A0AA38X107_9EURO|nr:hypothetical protein H2200_010914 [Cladophialophora chaetospira]
MDEDGSISVYDPAHKQWATEVKEECEHIQDKAERLKSDIEVHKGRAVALSNLAAEGKLSLEGLRKLTEGLEQKAGQLYERADAVELEAHIHMEQNIDDMDYLLPKKARNGRNKAMTEMFHAVEDTQDVRRDLEKTVVSVREKLDETTEAKTEDTSEDQSKVQERA